MKKRSPALLFIVALASSLLLFALALSAPPPTRAEMSAPPAAPNFYFGNLHAHTSYSDGSGTPKEAFKFARQTGNLDFMAITEHNHAAAGPTSGDRADGILIATDPTLYPKLIDNANDATEDGEFVAIYGQEFSTISKGNHTNAFMADKVITTSNGQYETVFTDDWFADFGVQLIQLNHPWDGKNTNGRKISAAQIGTNLDTNYGFNRFSSAAAFVRALDGRATLIEVVNGPGLSNPEEDETLFGTAKPAYYIAYLNLGLHLAPTGDQDNHYHTWGTLTETRTVVLAPKLTRVEILRAMKERRVYATEDMDLKVAFTINGKVMGSINPKLAPGVAAKIRVGISDSDEPDSAYRVRVFYDKAPGGPPATQINMFTVNNNGSGVVTHVPNNGKGYYFVVVTSTQSANEGYSAWTAPIWFE